MRCGGDKIWYHCTSETKFMDYYTKSETFSAQWPFTYPGSKLYSHKKRKSLLITNINNLGDSVAEGTVSEPACPKVELTHHTHQHKLSWQLINNLTGIKNPKKGLIKQRK